MQDADDETDKTGTTQQMRFARWRRLVFLGPSPSPPQPKLTNASRELVALPANRAMNVQENFTSSPEKPSQKTTLRASIAELLLVSKLRARSLLGCSHANHVDFGNRREAERKETLARYTQILSVTYKNWFPEEAKPLTRLPNKRQP